MANNTDAATSQDDTSQDNDNNYDLEFYWDPICPFAWITSRWILKVKEERPLKVDWKFICLIELNKNKNYEKFPPGYLDAHNNGKKMLRVAAAARREHGREVMEPLYTAFGESIWNRPPPQKDANPDLSSLATSMSDIATPEHLKAILEKVNLPTALADAAEMDIYDQELANESEEALSRTGKDVGTPIITYKPPNGPSFFGPVISAVPESSVEAAKYFDAVLALLEWPSFAELKRSLRDIPQLKVLGQG